MKKYKLPIATLILFASLIVLFSYQPKPAQGESWVKKIIGTELIPEGCAYGKQSDPGACGLKDVFIVGANIAKLILGTVGTLALLMFIYGGVLFIISSGNQEKVTKAKGILANALIGIVIIFSSWVIVNFLIIALTKGQAGLGDIGTLFEGTKWTDPPQ